MQSEQLSTAPRSQKTLQQRQMFVVNDCSEINIYNFRPNVLLLFLPRDATQSAVMRLHVVCPSASPSVCLSVRVVEVCF